MKRFLLFFSADRVAAASAREMGIIACQITDFGATSTTDLTTPFSDVSATITPLGGGVFRATLPASGNQSFYRVKRQPFSF